MKRTIAAFSGAVMSAALVLAGCSSSPKAQSLPELILSGQYDEARALFGGQTDVNEQGTGGRTALHAAAQVNEPELVSFLLIKGADTRLRDDAGDTPLHTAITYGSLDAAKVLAMVYGDIFEKDGYEVTALERALARGDDWYDAMITQQTGAVRDTGGQSIVHYFVKTRNEKAIQYCINKQLPLSVRDNEGRTPLHLAFESADDSTAIRIAANLILAGADPVGGDFAYFESVVRNHNMPQRFDDGQTALHLAAIQGHTGIVDYILNETAATEQAGVLSAQDISGATALHEAVRYGRTEIAAMLLDHGASPNATDSIGKTPLLVIIPRDAQGALYRTLVMHGADTGKKDTFGDTVLHVATLASSSTDTLAFLVENGAQVNERNKHGVTPLALAIENEIPEHIAFYARHGADIFAEDMDGRTPLSRALSSTSADALTTLVTAENVRAQDSAGNTPLHLAVRENAPVSYIDYLIALGADVDARNRTGDSALLLAAAQNKREAGELLLANGADIFATNTANNAPLRVALTNKAVQDWLITSRTLSMTDGSGNTPLHYAAEWGYAPSVSMLIERGARLDAVNANGETPVFSAVKADSAEIVGILAANGAVLRSSESLGRDNAANTPIHAAVRWDAAQCVPALTAHGVDINAQNMSGKTALSSACRAGKAEFAALLVRSGADVNAADPAGRTVLMDTIQTEDEALVQFLLASGASVSVQEAHGRNAFHEAALTRNAAIITMVRRAGGSPLNRDSYGESPFSLVLDADTALINAVLGNDPTIADSDGNTPVHIAVEKRVGKAFLGQLLDCGYPVSQRNARGKTALHIAVEQDSQELADVLLSRGADPYIQTAGGESALTAAFRTRNRAMLDAITAHNKTTADRTGDGILHYAARMADADTVAHLMSLGLDTQARNLAGETPAAVALRWERPDIAALLR